MLTVTLFGQADATWNGATIDLLRRQTRALFYRLAVQPDSISREQLCFLFWPDVADVTARRNLTRLLTHLRRALPDPDILVTTPDAVSLNAGIVISDAVDFEQYLRQAERQTDPDLLKQAVDLYLGPFLSGFSFPDCAEYDNWLANKRRAFERQYLHALTTLIDHAAAQQEHRTAIDYAHRYLEHDELDETVHRRLIELYAAAGDRVNAERQFEACTTILERELGVDPLPETRAAYEAALTEYPLPAPHPVPPLAWATLPGLDLPIVGRDDALAQLESCYHKAAAGSGSVVLISGEAGIGKSRLLQEFATRWEAEALVLAGAGLPGEQALPYLPVTQILRRGIHLSRGLLRVDPIWLAEASLLLPELRTLYPNLPAPLQMDAQQARTRLFEALTRITLALGQTGRPLLLCLDDLHWTDSATLDWLDYLSKDIANNRVLIVATYRKEELASVESLRHRLIRRGILKEVALDGLQADAIHQLFRHVNGCVQDGDTLARELQLSTGGNAFFCLEVIRATLEEHGTLEWLHFLDELALPQTVTETISARLRHLSSVARQVLEAGAVLGLTFTYELLRSTAGRTDLETVEGLSELVNHALLQEETGGFRFCHDIMHRTVYESIPLWRRKLLHRRAAEVLTKLNGADLDVVSGAIAVHYEQAALFDQAFAFYRLATNVAKRVFANQEALDYQERAIALLHTVRVDELTATQLYEEKGDLLALLGMHENARVAYHAAYSSTGEVEIVRRARLKRKQGQTQNVLHNRTEAFDLLQAAEEVLSADVQEVEWEWWQEWFNVQRALAEIHYHQARLSEMETILNRLHNIDQRATLEQKLAYYHLQVMLWNRQDRFQVSGRTVELVRTAYELAREMNNPLIRAEYTFSYGFSLLWHGKAEAAIEQLETSLKDAVEMQSLSLQNRSLAYLSIACRLMGDRARTSTYSERGQRTAEMEGQRSYIATARANRAWLHLTARQPDAAIHEGRTALATLGRHWYPFEWLARWPLLVVALQRNQLADAVVEVEAMLHPVQQVLPPHLTTTLHRALDCWHRTDIQTTTALLQQSVEIAHSIGHL
ncbi:AAA family ATPase [bacterium]|nr:AAA family ATPase [bacterium]